MAKLVMWAIRDKKTKRLLVFDAEVEEYGDYGGWENTYQTYQRAVIRIRRNDYGGNVFVTTDESLVDQLLNGVKSDYYSNQYRLSVQKDEMCNLEKVKVHAM